ncbi:oxygenase MpaB family protein [Nocardia aurantia]|uniref:ER-bound oxygenase mpaB/mpaB'/Rubber oxygenase catalytic domain-containing protein n=1 Tax=Nocardia aurantia TaxID=2585199 RepID=A0A7K0DL73_9NOCA|nr:oxygenase MpaB family protein [Nocardia aurantia]MQY26411.1 hypothetical protein [Nocardia aurantia]
MAANILTDPGLMPELRRVDHGFFGPDSVAWRVWTHPSILIGLQRAVAVQFLNPFFTAAHDDAQAIYKYPGHFYDMTLGFLLSGILGDSRTALQTSDFIMRIHTRATGIEPISGRRYHANNPETQLFTHIDGWQSMLKCYEVFGPGPLSPADDHRFWNECATAAELFTCKPDDIPRSRDGVREYYATLRPQLCVTEAALSGMRQLLATSGPNSTAKLAAFSRFATPATLITLPSWMRRLIGFDQPAAVDRAYLPFMRGLLGTLNKSKRATRTTVRLAAPISGRILRQHWAAGTPRRAEVATVAEARKLYRQELRDENGFSSDTEYTAAH